MNAQYQHGVDTNGHGQPGYLKMLVSQDFHRDIKRKQNGTNDRGCFSIAPRIKIACGDIAHGAGDPETTQADHDPVQLLNRLVIEVFIPEQQRE